MTTRPTVLVVEDDIAVRHPLEKFLEMNGFDVIAHDTADGALDHLATETVDAAVVDLRLAQGSGRDVILSIAPPTPIPASTSSSPGR